ncbi:MAG: DUF11 domain-containing protein, partial [Bifidobacteriaceae bacterium]|nr:DUF11 domain-containing protein [Bifidobacteriaceae bacterium]
MKRILRRTALGTAAVLTVALTGLVGFAPAQAETPPTTANFTAVFNENANGGIIAIGNSLLRCPLTVGTACTNALAGAAQDNNNFRMEDIDADGTAYNTINSSSSNLNLPDGATVLFAGLYWGARLDVGTTSGTMPVRAGDPAKANQIKFRLPNATSYESLTGEVIALNTGQKSAYQAYLDVTDLVRQGGNGAYWGADVETGTGLDRYAGWALVVAYSAPGLPLRNLTVYQGFKTVGSGAPADIEISDFLAPASGPVDVQLAMVAYEGDLAQTGDYARLNSAAGGTSLSTQLATPMSPGSNFFDSVNSLAGASVTTRDPAYKNMLGFDIKNLDASGTIPNGARTAQFSFRSAGDVYYPGVLALAINIYAPDFTSSTKTVVNVTSPKQPTNPGDTLQYTVMFANTGQDGATNAVGCDTLPAEVTYVPDSLWLLGTPDAAVDTPVKLPDNGDSFAKYDDATKTLCINLGRGAQAYKDGGGGALNILDATVYQFQVTVNEDAGGKTVSNTAHLSYKTQTEGLDAVYDPPPAVTEVGLKADVKIAKTMDPSPAIAGQAGVTTMTVTNLGPSQATGVQVSDPLPADSTATAVSYTIENP